METEKFKSWLIHYKVMLPSVAQSRSSNCARIEQYYNDLDQHFRNDRCESIMTELVYTANDELFNRPSMHRIPINGNIRTGTSTLKAALKLYIEFKNHQNGAHSFDGEIETQNRSINNKIKSNVISQTRDIRSNVSGISFENLFGVYLKNATTFEVIDPYIQQSHQLKNFMELCNLIEKQKPLNNKVKIILTTKINERDVERNNRYFEQMKASLTSFNIDLEVCYSDDCHDRSIIMNNGYKIILGRGLDIWTPPQFGMYDIENFDQEKRKCKAFNITIVKI